MLCIHDTFVWLSIFFLGKICSYSWIFFWLPTNFFSYENMSRYIIFFSDYPQMFFPTEICLHNIFFWLSNEFFLRKYVYIIFFVDKSATTPCVSPLWTEPRACGDCWKTSLTSCSAAKASFRPSQWTSCVSSVPGRPPLILVSVSCVTMCVIVLPLDICMSDFLKL